MVTRSSEFQEQKAFFTYVRYRALSDARYKNVFSVPNGGARHPLVGLKMAESGLSRGVPDIAILVANNKYHGAFLELKIRPNKPTKEQREWLERLNSSGYYATLAYSCDECIKVLEDYLSNKI